MKHSAKRLTWSWIAGGLLLGLAAIGSGCAGVKADAGGQGGNGVRPGTGGRGVQAQPCRGPNGLCEDFPTAPIVEPGASTNICNAPSGAGPCITEPEDGSLFPNNWLRPRVSVQGAGGPMKITFHSERETNDLVVYTTTNNWKMPKDMWIALASHVQDSSIEVTVCGASGGASKTHFTIAPASAGGTMVFWAANPAYVNLDPHMCQADVTPCLPIAELRGFAVGNETTEPVLKLADVVQRSRTDAGNPAPVTCIGCHSATPDKSFVTFADSYPWRTVTASVAGVGVLPNPSGATFPTVTPGGLAALLQPGWGPFSFSLNKSDVNPFWMPGRRIGIGALGLKNPLADPDYGNGPDQNDSPNLAWFNLEAPNIKTGNNANWAYVSFAPGAGIDSGNALGFISHTGDMCGSVPCGAGMPSWSHDGATIVYVSTNASLSGRFNKEQISTNYDAPTTPPAQKWTKQNDNPQRLPGMTNLFTVPFNGGLGGPAAPLNGAATTQREEIYPAFSPDDRFVAYTAVPAGESMYANPNAEIYVVPVGGAVSAERLKANDPPSCTNKPSPGINNHWPKWSPDVATSSKGKYYWMIFSSNRSDIPPLNTGTKLVQISQLYLAPILIDENFQIQSYPAIYLWNQPTDRVNTTPAWETFEIPVIP